MLVLEVVVVVKNPEYPHSNVSLAHLPFTLARFNELSATWEMTFVSAPARRAALIAKGSDKQHQSNGSVAIAARATGPSLEAVVDPHHPVHMCHEPQVLTPMPRSHTPAAPIACPPFVQRVSAAQTTTLCAQHRHDVRASA